MATLSNPELIEMMRHMCNNTATQTWTKAQVSAALQAVEDRVRLASTQNAIANDIEGAAPGVFSSQQKLIIFGVWCVSAARRLGVT